MVYGAWPYPAYPPVYLPPPPGYVFGAALVSGIAFATGVAVVGSLWGWARPGWGGGYVNVNVNRYNTINVNRTHINSNVWQPNRPGGRPGRPAAPPEWARRPPHSAERPARQRGRPPQRQCPGECGEPAGQAGRGAAQPREPPCRGECGSGQPSQPWSGQPAQSRTGQHQSSRWKRVARTSRRPAGPPATGTRPAAQRPAPARQPPAFNGMNSGRQAAQNGARGSESRAASQVQRPSRPNAGALASGGAAAQRPVRIKQ